MATARLGVSIARPVEDVFAVLSEVRNVPRWSANTIEEQLITPGPMRRGSRRRAVIKGILGRRMVNEAEMVEFEPNRRMVVMVTGSPVPVRIDINLRDEGVATRLYWRAEFTPRGPMRPFGQLLALFYRLAFQKDLDRLKTLMERREL